MKFASSNDLVYIGESSALADINIKETVENLMESNYNYIINICDCRNTWSTVENGWKENTEEYEAEREVLSQW